MKKIGAVVVVVFIALIVAFRGVVPVEREKTVFAMDTIINLKIRGTEEQLEEMVEIIKNAEELYSAYNENSLVYKLNKEKYIKTEEKEIFIFAYGYSAITEGAFDMSIMPLSRLWKINSENPDVPSENEISEALKKVDFNNVEIGKDYIKLKNGAEIDLGGIVKGYVTDKLSAYVKGNGIKYAIIDLGGNVYVLGKEDMTVGIQNPFGQRGELLCTVDVNDKCVVTSGTYERNFEKDGKLYHHIFDSKTGKPAETGISEVTVIGDDGALCDALSTAILVMGEEKCEKLYNKLKNFEYIIVKDKKVIVSEGLEIKNLNKDYREVK